MSRCDLIKILCTPFLLCILIGSNAQCPDNIGFEKGTFENWVISVGKVSPTSGDIISSVVPSSYRANILKNIYPQETDPFGLFPVNCPNGSNYSIKLGDSIGTGMAQTVSYTFTVPANQDNYSIIYNYAVVLQDPGHFGWAQPSFSSKVFDVTSNHYIDCGAFNFVASSSLPGFQKSAIGVDVYYKPWAPITIKLVGYAGKTVRLEFTSHDCAFGPHFGYAYIDINENCSSPISGNVFCNNTIPNSTSLTAPAGFSGYKWYDDSYSQVLSSTNVLKLATQPVNGTNYHVIITPYPDLGCLDTLHTTIHLSAQNFKLQTVDTIVGCNFNMVDLTAAFVTAGSSSGLTYSYFTNLSLTDYVPTPKQIYSAGTYYIKAVNSDGCSDLKPVAIVFANAVNFVVNDPAPICFPQKIDLTNPTITAGSDAGLVFSYWKDTSATISITDPHTIDASAVYFIKSNNIGGCPMVKPVHVIVSKNPVLTINSQTACGSVNITSPTGFISDQSDIISSFWKDSNTSINLTSPDSIKMSGTYYVKATNPVGCTSVAAIQAIVFPVPNLVVNNPAPACLPNTIDLTNTAITAGSEAGLVFHYWNDSAATNSLSNPQLINVSGTYFIKVTNDAGCSIVKPVAVSVLQSALLTIKDQTACGFVNINSPIGFTTNMTDVKTSFWQDSTATINVAAPDSIKVSGTYYIKVTNTVGCSTVAAIKATVFPIPYFTIAQMPVVYLPATVDLTALVKPTTNTIASFTYWQDLATTIAVINPTSVTSNGMYYIKAASSDGCMVLDSVALIIKVPPIIPPNVFSPNGDGINDTWDIPLLQFFPNCSVEVYNRYGQLVFKSKGYSKNWDGTFNNQTLPIGTYYFIIKTSSGANPLAGSVLILR